MVYIQQDTPPPNKIQVFSLQSFVGGLNNRSDQLEDNQASYVLNMDFADDTLMEKRKGQAYFDNLTMPGGDAVVLIDEYKPYQDNNVLIRASENKMYIEDVVLTDLQGRPHGTNHDGKYVFADGDKFYAYGWFHQEDSTYRKVEGTAINDYVLVEIVSPPENFTPLGTEHTEGVVVVDYDNFEVWYEPCEHEVEDTYKGANVVPGGVRYVASHNGRLYLAGADEDDDNVFISDVSNPYYYPVALPIQLPPNSDRIMALAVFDNSVVVGRKYDVHVIFGQTNRPDMGVQPFYLHRLNTHTGFASQGAAVTAHNYLFFLGSDGEAYALGTTRADEKQLSTQVLTRNVKLDKAPIEASNEELAEASSAFHDGRWYVSIGEKVLVYSYRHMAWTMWDNFHATSFYVLDDELMWGRVDGETACFSKEYYLDFGMAYKALWYSKYFDMDDANSFKHFREVFVVAHTFPEYESIIDLIFEIDYQEVKERVTVTNNLSVWGKSKWGERWVNRIINESLPFQIGRRGRNIRFKFSNGFYLHEVVDNYGDLETVEGRVHGVVVFVLHSTGSGTATSTTDNTLTDTGKAWVENEFAGTRVKITDGEEEYYRIVESNTEDTLTIEEEWKEGYSGTPAYSIEKTHYIYLDGEWVLLEEDDINQRMKIHQLNGDYEMRGKR